VSVYTAYVLKCIQYVNGKRLIRVKRNKPCGRRNAGFVEAMMTGLAREGDGGVSRVWVGGWRPNVGREIP